ncbi:S-layer homology domain-containing protein [Paenibacillus amylolyticus]
MIRRLFICLMAMVMISFPAALRANAAEENELMRTISLTSGLIDSNKELASVTGAVYDFASTGRAETTASFQWTAADSRATEIVIEQSPAGQNKWTKAVTGTIPIDATSVIVSELIAGTVYDFRLVVIGGENAGISNTVTIKTDIDIISKLINGGHLFDWNPGDGTVYHDLVYGNKERNKYDLYIPTNASKTEDIGVILNLHGGSWVEGDKSGMAAESKRFAQAGYITASMNYTLIQEGNGATIMSMMDEIQACVTALKKELTNRGYHVSRLTIAGYSAGGHLASLYSYSRADVTALPVVLVLDSVGPSDLYPDTWAPMFDATMTAGILSLMVGEVITLEDIDSGIADEKIKAVSPLQHVSSDSPPTIMAYGVYDQIVAPGHHQKLASALKQAGVDHKYILYPNSDHALGNDPDKTAERISSSLAYLEKYMSPEPLTPIGDFASTEKTVSSATFSWTMPVNADRIIIEQSLAGQNNWATSETKTIATNASSATIKELSSGTTYDFRLVVTGGVNAGNSNTVSVTTRNDLPVNSPQSPTISSQSPAKGNTIEQSTDLGVFKTVNQNGQTLETFSVDSKKLTDYLSSKKEGSIVPISMQTKSGVFSVELSGPVIWAMDNKKVILEIQTEQVTYRLPAKLIHNSAVSSSLGDSISMDNIKVQIDISATLSDKTKHLESVAQEDEFSLIVPPMDFTLRLTQGEKSLEISKFNEYVERTFTLPDNVNPNKIMTGVIVGEDGQARSVPTKILEKHGKHYAQIKSMANGTYAVIWYPVEFVDTVNHWAEKAIHQMGSRMVTLGTDRTQFNPDRVVSGAEFVAILARGLGLQIEGETTMIKNHPTFRPNEAITREQAMVWILRAIEVTGLKPNFSTKTKMVILEQFSDAGKVSDWSKEAVEFCLNNGIVNGRSLSSLAADTFLTRAEVVTIVQRILEKAGLV